MKAYLEQMGILNPKAVYRNLAPAELVEHALERGEGKLCSTGAFVINTGKYTGRSPDDRFIVDEPSVHNLIDWGKVNVPISSEKADAIYVKMCAYMQNREVFVVDGFVGADPQYAQTSSHIYPFQISLLSIILGKKHQKKKSQFSCLTLPFHPVISIQEMKNLFYFNI